MATVCVEIAVRDDPRLPDALASLAAQSRRPERVLIAASPATPEELLATARARGTGLRIDVARYPGGVVDARAASLAQIREEILVFLDSDERAPPEWLSRLVAPVEDGRATFSAGPTRPVGVPATPYERYADLLEATIYEDLVPRRVTYVPLQNSAWHAAELRALGFDPRIPYAEDHDLEVRAERAGGHGLFVPEAWVYHDKSDERSFARWARKRYRYLVAMAMSLMKNGELGGRLGESRRPVPHPLRYVEAMMKPIALVHATIRWRRVRGRAAG